MPPPPPPTPISVTAHVLGHATCLYFYQTCIPSQTGMWEECCRKSTIARDTTSEPHSLVCCHSPLAHHTQQRTSLNQVFGTVRTLRTWSPLFVSCFPLIMTVKCPNYAEIPSYNSRQVGSSWSNTRRMLGTYTLYCKRSCHSLPIR